MLNAFKGSNKNTRVTSIDVAMTPSQQTFTCLNPPIEILEKRCKICSKLTIKTPECGVFMLTLNIFNIFF